MATPLEQSGGQKQKQTRYAPIWTNRFFTGIWTQRNPLRDAATTYLYEKFYAGSRYDSIIAGNNCELTNRLTLQRRYGNSVYNSQTFSAIDSFYPFPTFINNVEAIKVIADTATNIYDATGGSTKTNLLTKAAGAGQAYFQGVANTLYIGDGVEQKKFLQPSKGAWTANTSYNNGDFILDSNNNLQQFQYTEITSISHIKISNNIMTVTVTTPSDIANVIVGNKVTFITIIGGALFLNGVTLQVISTTSTTMVFNYSHVDYNANQPGGTGATIVDSPATSGNSLPTFSSTPGGGSSIDGLIVWICRGSAVSNWGIQTPTVAPNVTNTALTPTQLSWAASTWYGSSVGLLIVDNQGTPAIQKVTTAGTTGGSQPTWNPSIGGTTTDNTAVWTNQGVAAWQSGIAYVAGNLIAVNYTVTVMVPEQNPDFDGSGQPLNIFVPVVTNYSDFFQCTAAGTTAGGQPSWIPGIGSITQDNTVTWTNIGTQLVWGTIGAATLVASVSQIIDLNGNYENVIATGKSAASHPTWATALGGTVTETSSSLVWQNADASSQIANTGNWIYAFAPRNSITGYTGACSPQSQSIQKAANSFIMVQGNFVSDPQCDTIRLFRTVQGGSTFLVLADIANPASGVWSYQDTNADSNLNFLIQGDVSGNNAPPPLGLIALTYHLNRIFGVVRNTVYYSTVQSATTPNPYECFPALNSFTYPSAVIRLVPTNFGLLVHTVSDIYIISGQANSSSPLFSALYIKGIGLANYNALDVNGSIIYMYTTDRQLLSFDPTSGISEIGFPIGDDLAAFTAANVYVTWHVDGSSDKALFVSDGSTGWFRLNPTSAPESGQTWSPKATLAAGVKAVQSIEVTPGVHRLLISPATSGNILQRDLTSFSDGGASYTCDFTIGSIVLAHPGQKADIKFITTDCTSAGSRPTLTYLLDEISGTFQTLPPSHPSDPPNLPASTSTHADRFYFASANPSECRHLQLKFSFPSEAAKNELLSYTIFGALMQEL